MLQGDDRASATFYRHFLGFETMEQRNVDGFTMTLGTRVRSLQRGATVCHDTHTEPLSNLTGPVWRRPQGFQHEGSPPPPLTSRSPQIYFHLAIRDNLEAGRRVVLLTVEAEDAGEVLSTGPVRNAPGMHCRQFVH